jgi:hypothetical protein
MAQSQAFYPDGTPIPSEKLAEAIKGGKAGYEAGSIVKMVGPDGKRYNATAESVPEAFSKGYRPESPEETLRRELEAKQRKVASDHPFLSGLAAASKSALDTYTSLGTLGASDAAKAISPTVGQALSPGGLPSAITEAVMPGTAGMKTAAQEVSPISSAIGTLHGIGGALITPQPITALGTVGKAFPSLARTGQTLEAAAVGSTVGKAALTAGKLGAEGAVQGGIYGFNQELARASVGPDPISAERLLAAAGSGAGIGAVLGVGLGGLGSLGKSAFESTARYSALQAVGMNRSAIKKFRKMFGEEKVNALNEWIMKESELAVAAKRAGSKDALDPLAVWGGIKERAAANEAIRKKAGQQLEELLKEIDGLSGSFNKTLLQSDAASLVNELKGGVGETVQHGNKLNSDFIKAPPGRRGMKNRVVVDAKGRAVPKPVEEIDNLFDQWVLRGHVDKGTVFQPGVDNTYNTIKREFRDRLERNLEQQIEEISRQARAKIESAKTSGLPISVTDENLAGAYEKYMHAKSQYHMASSISDSLNAAVSGNIATPPLKYIDVLSGGIGATHGLGRKSPIAGGLTGLAITKLASAVSHETGAAILAKAYNRIRGGTDKAAMVAAGAVSSAVSKNSFKVRPDKFPDSIAKLATKFVTSSEAPSEASKNPEIAIRKISSAVQPLSEVDSKLAAATTRTLAEDLKWLSQKLPGVKIGFDWQAIPGSGTASGVTFKTMSELVRSRSSKKAVLPRNSAVEMARYNRFEKNLSDPLGNLIAMARSGKLSPELPQVLRERRPFLREQIKSEYTDNLVKMIQQGKKPSHTSLVQASLVTGMALDITMKPEFIVMSQSVWEEQASGEGEKQAEPSPRMSGRRVSDKMRERAQDRQTASEDVERRK